MTLKAGTVCYIVDAPYRRMNDRIVTLTGAISVSERGKRALVFEPQIDTPQGFAYALEPQCLRPISDPDQPVDVTSDTDEPVTV